MDAVFELQAEMMSKRYSSLAAQCRGVNPSLDMSSFMRNVNATIPATSANFSSIKFTFVPPRNPPNISSEMKVGVYLTACLFDCLSICLFGGSNYTIVVYYSSQKTTAKLGSRKMALLGMQQMDFITSVTDVNISWLKCSYSKQIAHDYGLYYTIV